MNSWLELHAVNRALEAAPLVPFACAWVRRHQIPYAFRPVYYYVGIRCLLYFLDSFSRIVFRNNVYLYHLATVLLVLLLAQAYRRLKPRRFRHIIQIGIWTFGVVALLDATVLNGLLTDVNTYSQAFGCAFLISLAILHIVDLTRRDPKEALESQPEFFLSVAVLVYCSSSIVSYVALNAIYHSGYDEATLIRLDTLISAPDMVLMATQMGLFAWMFCFFPSEIRPLQALPSWLHYSKWPRRRPYRLLGRALPALFFSRSRLGRVRLPVAHLQPHGPVAY